jgi:hypothetical protein
MREDSLNRKVERKDEISPIYPSDLKLSRRVSAANSFHAVRRVKIEWISNASSTVTASRSDGLTIRDDGNRFHLDFADSR